MTIPDQRLAREAFRYPGIRMSFSSLYLPLRMSPSGVRKMHWLMYRRHDGKMEGPRPDGKIHLKVEDSDPSRGYFKTATESDTVAAVSALKYVIGSSWEAHMWSLPLERFHHG